jgi:hypothetical protein
MNLTKNFTLAEFNFRDLPLDETLTANAQALAENLQAVRDFLGKKVYVSSWYRPTTINRNAGGSKTSQHLHGVAVDFYVRVLDAAGLDDLFKLIIDGKIKLPHACSQIIRETKDTEEGRKEWIHMGIKTFRWIEAQKEVISSNANSMQKSKATKRLTHCECLRTPNTIDFELIKYIPYGEFG